MLTPLDRRSHVLSGFPQCGGPRLKEIATFRIGFPQDSSGVLSRFRLPASRKGRESNPPRATILSSERAAPGLNRPWLTRVYRGGPGHVDRVLAPRAVEVWHPLWCGGCGSLDRFRTVFLTTQTLALAASARPGNLCVPRHTLCECSGVRSWHGHFSYYGGGCGILRHEPRRVPVPRLARARPALRAPRPGDRSTATQPGVPAGGP